MANGLNWNQHQEAADDTTAWAQANLDAHPSNSPFWDSSDGQETLEIVQSIGLQAATTEQERAAVYRVARKCECGAADALNVLRANEWDEDSAAEEIGASA